MVTKAREAGLTIQEGPPPTWHDPVSPHANGDRRRIATETNSRAIVTRGMALVQALLDPAKGDIHKRYYDISRDWHDHFEKFDNGTNLDPKELEYGDQLCTVLEQIVAGRLELRDAANMHLAAFWILRKAMYILTSHDVDPDSGQITVEAADGATGGMGPESSTYLMTWHWTPNGAPSDTGVRPTVTSQTLGLDPTGAP